jgi:ABC-type transporter Mla subunit MlaD
MCLEEDADRQMVDGVPSLLVTIGILGTFLGLGIALQVAGGGWTSSESALASLDTLLETVAFKFQTSAWGILLSIVFQVAVVNPHHRWAERVQEQAERAMLAAYLPAGEAMRVALEPVIASLGDATREVAKTSGRMVTAMMEFQSKMNASTLRLEKAMGALDGLGKRLDEAVERMGSSVASTLKEEVARQGKQARDQQGALQAELERVATAVGDLQATTGEVGPTLQSAVSSMQKAVTEGLSAELRGVAQAISKLDGVMGSLEKRMSSSLNSVVEAIGKMERAQDTAFKQLDDGLTVRLGEVASVLTGLDASLKAQLDNLNSELGTHLGATKEHTLELSVTMTEVREALQGLEQHVGRMVDVLEVAESGRAADELSDLLDLGAFGAQIADDG